MPLELPSDKVQVGKEEYTFNERQGEEDVSGELNYPNKANLVFSTDIAWSVIRKLQDHIQHHSDQPTVTLILYGKLSEGA